METSKSGFIKNATMLLVLISIMILPSIAYSQENATAVHDAEAAVATLDQRLVNGKAVYEANCAACHQSSGEGLAGGFPPLAKSDFLKADRKKVLQAALFGLSGPI